MKSKGGSKIAGFAIYVERAFMSLIDGVLVETVDEENTSETHESLNCSKDDQPPPQKRFINGLEDSMNNGPPPLVKRK